jgi:co-chaperonin GroES (HSP10)
MRLPKKKMTSSGIILAAETVDTEKAQNPVGKVVSIGPLAFKKRDTMESWPEGSWCEPGDYIRVPKWGGDRWYVSYGDKGKALFMILNDHEIIAKLTGDPLTMDTPL